jgi:hypothetical protein
VPAGRTSGGLAAHGRLPRTAYDFFPYAGLQAGAAVLGSAEPHRGRHGAHHAPRRATGVVQVRVAPRPRRKRDARPARGAALQRGRRWCAAVPRAGVEPAGPATSTR